MKTEYTGIDYSHGKANIDNDTGIRFGVIPLHALEYWAVEEFDCIYGDFDENDPDDEAEPVGWALDNWQYTATLGTDDQDIFITKSIYYTHAQFCSPCAPGAGYLLNPCEAGPKTYCFGHDWFEGNKAPYPVYSVETGLIINPETRE